MLSVMAFNSIGVSPFMHWVLHKMHLIWQSQVSLSITMYSFFLYVYRTYWIISFTLCLFNGLCTSVNNSIYFYCLLCATS